MPKTLQSTLVPEMVFDPLEVRSQLDQPLCGVEFHTTQDVNEVEKKHVLGNYANGMLIEAIRCLAVGYDATGRELLEKAKLWFERAILLQESKTKNNAEYYFAKQHKELALCNWFLTGQHDAENMRQYLQWIKMHDQDIQARDKIGISYAIVEYLDSLDYEATLDLIETTPGLKTPTSAKRVSGTVGAAYVVAARHVRNEFTQEEVETALQRLLQRKMCEWVRGHYIDIARWLKVAYFNETDNPLTPKRALLKMYDYLIDVEYPGDA